MQLVSSVLVLARGREKSLASCFLLTLMGQNNMETKLHPETLQRVAMLIQEKAELFRCFPEEVTLNKDHLVHALECIANILENMAAE
jgi:hypothetical protein